MYKVFINNLPLFLCTEQEKSLISGLNAALECKNEKQAKEMLSKYLSEGNTEVLAACHSDTAQLFKWFFGDFKLIEAAGGVVKNQYDKALFIFRNEKWDLPKGKLDKGEDRKDAAIREIEEECGIHGHKIASELQSTWHVYPYKDHYAIKITYWYTMNYPGDERLVPQGEEGITKVEWRSKDELADIYANTFESIKDVIKEAMG